MRKEVICEKCKGSGCNECNDNGFIVKEVSRPKRKMKPEHKRKMIETQIKVFKHRRKPFYQIDKKTGEIIAFWNSLGEINRLLGYRPYHIQRVLHGKFKTFKKYIWKYVQTK